jgi:hypothetical protein
MPQYLPLPDGTFLPIEEGQNPREVWLRAIEVYPEAFGIEKEKPSEPTVGGQIKEFAKGLAPGAIGLAESAGTGISALLPDEQEKSARRIIGNLAASAREPFAAAPGYEETVGRKFGESVGSVLPFLAMGPLGVAGRLGMAGLGVGAGAGEARVRAEQGGADAEQRSLATGLGGVVGATEMFAPARILGRLSAPVQAGAVAVVKRALMAGGEEAAQEAASQVAQNLIAKGIYKPEQEIIEQVGESAAYGGATGALVQGLLDMAIGRRAKGPTTPTQPMGGAVEPAITPPVTPPGPSTQGMTGAPVGAITPEETALDEQYQQLLSTFKELKAERKGKGKQPDPSLDAEIAAVQEQLKAISPLHAPIRAKMRVEREKQALLEKQMAFADEKANRMQEMRAAQEAEQLRVAGLTPEEYAAERTFAVPEGPQVPKGTMPTPVGPTPQTAAQAYMAQQIALADENELTNQKERDDQVPDYAQYLLANPEMAAQLVQFNAQIPTLNSKQNAKVLELLQNALKLQRNQTESAAAKQAQAAAEQAQADADRRQALMAGQMGARPGEELAPVLQTRKTVQAEKEALGRIGQRKLGMGVASTDQFDLFDAEAGPQETPPAGSSAMGQLRQRLEIEAPLMAASEAYKQARKDFDGSPEKQAALNAAQDAYAAAQEQYQKDLKRQREEEPIYTAEEEERTEKERKFTKVPSEGFRLFNRQGAPVRPSDYNNMSQRLASVLARNDLPNDTYQFLRRAERALPRYDATAKEVRELRGDYRSGTGAKREGMLRMEEETGGFLSLLDEQLARIEREEEGFPKTQRTVIEQRRTRGTTADVTEPTQAEALNQRTETANFAKAVAAAKARAEKAKAEYEAAPASDRAAGKKLFESAERAYQALVEYGRTRQIEQPGSQEDRTRTNIPGVPKSRPVEARTGRTLRGKTIPLSLQAELEPLIRAQEEAAGQGPLPVGQRELFEELEGSVGFARDTRAQFVRFLRESAVVKKLRAELNKAGDVINRAQKLPKLQQEIKDLQERVAAMQAADVQYSKAMKTVRQHGKDVKRGETDLKQVGQAFTALEVSRMELAGYVDDLQTTKGALEAQLQRFYDTVALFPEMAFAADIDPLKKELADTQARLEEAQKDFAEVRGNMDLLAVMLKVEKARFELATLNPDMVGRPVLQKAQEKLRAAQIEAGKIEQEVGQMLKEEGVAEGKAQRAAAAINRAQLERDRVERDKQEQKRLEAQYSQKVEGTQYPAISEAKRLAREAVESGTQPEMSAAEKAQAEKSPTKVLGGYRSRITELEKQMQKAHETSSGFRMKELQDLLDARDNAQKAYNNAQSSAERTKINDTLTKAEKAYDDAADKLATEPLTWKGMAEQQTLLRDLYWKEELLGYQLQTGQVAEPEGRGPKEIRVPSKAQQKAVAKALQSERVKDRAAQAEAPTTSGETFTRSEVKKLSTPTKTVYSSKGVGQERLTKDRDERRNRILEKQKAGIPLNAMEEAALLALAIPISDTQKTTEKTKKARGVEVTSPDLTQDQVTALENNNLQATLRMLSTAPGTTKLNQVVAQHLATMLDKTKVSIEDRLVDEHGKEVLGMATSKLIQLNRNGGLTQEILLHEGTHAAAQRVIDADEKTLTRTQLIAKRELMALWNAIRNDPSITSVSAKADLGEFVAEVMSNSNLQRQLQKKRWKMSDAWEGFKSTILRMLGIEHPETMLGAAFQSVDALMMPSSVRVETQETARPHRLATKDIAALHSGSNSMKQFADQFGADIKAKDRTAEDANRIGRDYLNAMYDNPKEHLPEVKADTLDYSVRMPDGEKYNPDNALHYVQADAATFANLEAQKDPDLREKEANAINQSRTQALKRLLEKMMKKPEYTFVEQALVAKAAAKYGLLSDKTGRLKLATIGADNRHLIAVVSSADAGRVIEQLRKGLPLKEAFLAGMQENADVNAEKNKVKNGWQKFEQSTVRPAPQWPPRISTGVPARPIRPIGAPAPVPQPRNADDVVVRLTAEQKAIVKAENANRAAKDKLFVNATGEKEVTRVKDFLTAYYVRVGPPKTAYKTLEQSAEELNAGAANTSWCTGKDVSTAATHIKHGDFYIYYKDGKPEVAVRMKGKTTIAELRGNTESQGLTTEQEIVAQEFLLQNKEFEQAAAYLEALKRKQTLTEVLKNKKDFDLETLLNLGEYLDFNGNPDEYTLAKLLDFGMLDGELGQRPKPTDTAITQVTERVVAATRSAIKENIYPGITMSLRPRNGGFKAFYDFEGVEYSVDADKVLAVDGLLATRNTKIVLPNLTYVRSINMPPAGDIVLPNIQHVQRVYAAFNAPDEETALSLAGNAKVDVVTYLGINEDKHINGKNVLTINGAQTIGEVNLIARRNNSLGLRLPDALYTPLGMSVGELYETSNYAFTKAMTKQLHQNERLKEIEHVFNTPEEAEGYADITDADIKAHSDFMAGLQAKLKAASPRFAKEVKERLESIPEFGIEPITFVAEWAEAVYGVVAEDVDSTDAMVAVNKKLNAVFEITGRGALPEVTGAVYAPNYIADTPPIQTLTENEERPMYARAQAPGFESALAAADDLIASKPTVRQQVMANTGLAFRTQNLDRLAPLEKVAYEMLEPLKGLQMMSYLRSAEQKMSYVQQAVARGVPQRVEYKRKDGRSEYIIESVPGVNLVQVVNTLKNAPNMNAEAANRLFTMYLLSKRADRVGYDKLNFSVKKDSIEQAVRQIESNKALTDVFEKARGQYNEYNRNLIQFLEQSGHISKKVAKELSETNDYIPYYREQNGNAVLMIGGEGTYTLGNLKDQPQLRELVGGEQKVLDFLTSSVQNTSMILDLGLRNQATKNAMFELQSIGLGEFLTKETAGPDIVRFKDDGVDKYFRVNTDSKGIPADLLVKGMEGIPVNNSKVVSAMGYASTLVRKGVMLNPLYSFRQLFRDSTAAPILSGANFVPVFGALKELGSSATKDKMEARGITGGQVFTGTNEDLTRILKDFQEGKMGLGQLVARAEGIAMEADAATRRAQYNSYIAQGLSEMEASLMALESMNFNRKGLSPSARLLSTVIPFFNAQLQSLDVLYRAFAGKMPMNERLDIQGKLLRRGALLSATAVAYALLMQDDDAYKNATPEQKYGNFFLRIPGLDEPLRIPVPFEIGYIFKGIPEAVVNIMRNERGGEEAYEAFKQIAIQTVPGGSSLFLPAGIKPIIETAAGYSFFTGRRLESKAEEMMLPEFRFRDNTSELAKYIGSAAGVSPIKIENLVRGYTGGMGVALMQTFNFAAPTGGSPEKAAKRLSDTPLVGGLFQPNDAGGIINATYDRMEDILQVKRSYDDLIKDGRTSQALELLQSRTMEIAAASTAGNAKAQLAKITQAMNAVKASNMSAAEKREQLDKLQKIRIMIAQSVRGVLDKTTRQ